LERSIDNVTAGSTNEVDVGSVVSCSKWFELELESRFLVALEVSGNTVKHDLSHQLDYANDLFFASKSLRGSPQVLAVCWMGINDCLSDRTDANDLEAIIEKIFEAMHDLYVKWKVRSFVIMDIPPLERSPGGVFWNLDSEKFDTWNEKLLQQARMFAKVDSKASVFVVSAHKIVSEILNYPNNFGLSNPDETEPSIASEGSSSGNSDDSTTSESSGSKDLSNSSSGEETDSEESINSFASGGPDPEESSDFGEIPDIWQDDIHLSSDAHRVFADRLLRVFDT